MKQAPTKSDVRPTWLVCAERRVRERNEAILDCQSRCDTANKKIGEFIRYGREAGGHTLMKTAAWMKMPASGLKAIEEGKLPITPRQLEKFYDLMAAHAKKRLEHLRKELEAERISYGELVELQELREYIEPGDVQLLEAAGVPEHP